MTAGRTVLVVAWAATLVWWLGLVVVRLVSPMVVDVTGRACVRCDPAPLDPDRAAAALGRPRP